MFTFEAAAAAKTERSDERRRVKANTRAYNNNSNLISQFAFRLAREVCT
jgi:hypothetical protein